MRRTGAYLRSALRAGEWSYEHQYRLFEYRGGPCDTSDILDKESGIYAMFAFIALYDVTDDRKWLEAAQGAADYAETFTFVWHFTEQEYRSRYHWLPWCTFVEVDPASRFIDTFGYHEIADIERLPLPDRRRLNSIYARYAEGI